MILRWIFLILLSVFFILILSTSVVAQDADVPPPYTGLKNPFPWDDASVHTIGEQSYQQYCLGCHGVDGSNIPNHDFSTENYRSELEDNADYMFWVLSEGRTTKGMPSYKSSLSEEQRWHVLTFIWSLSMKSGSDEIGIDDSDIVAGGRNLVITAPSIGYAGQTMTITAKVEDSFGNPIKDLSVSFFDKIQFFASELILIGNSTTDDNGVAVIEYNTRKTGEAEVVVRATLLEHVPSPTGEVEFVPHFKTYETTAVIDIVNDGRRFYYPQVGINIPTIGDDMYLGPISQIELGEMGAAPKTVIKLPTGHLAWLSPLLFACMAIWIVYVYVFYQVFHIPETGSIGTEVRRIPLIGLVTVAAFGITLILMLISSPISNPIS